MVDGPPTFYAAGVLFGCRDGRVYRLRASDGALEWRFLAAPSERIICSYGRPESAWPVHGPVLVVDGKAGFVAGHNSFLAGGLYYYRLDAVSGVLLEKNVIHDNDPLKPFGTDGRNARWDMQGSLNDVLSSADREGFYLRQRRFSWGGEPQPGSSHHLFSPAGLLDQSMHHRYYWVYAQRYRSGVSGAYSAQSNPSGLIMCFGDDRIYGFRASVMSFGRQRGKENIGKLYAWKNYGTETVGQAERAKPAWARDLPFYVNAMVLTEDALFMAGPIGSIEESPEAYHGTMGSCLWAVDCKTGEKRTEYELPCRPVFDGMVAADGRIYVSLANGEIQCWAGREE
jgi:outer membrane protein assembly factor BamB